MGRITTLIEGRVIRELNTSFDLNKSWIFVDLWVEHRCENLRLQALRGRE